MSDDITQLTMQLRAFARERDWEQFHSPKNLSMAIAVEASELLEHFQWLKEEQSKQLNDDQKRLVSYEMADVFLYLLRLADQLDVDIVNAAREKMVINNEKYPAELARGRADKYTAYKKD